jgi:hypothetical protein
LYNTMLLFIDKLQKVVSTFFLISFLIFILDIVLIGVMFCSFWISELFI